MSYIGPGEIIGIGVLAFVFILLLIVVMVFRKKIKFRKDSDPGLGSHTATDVSAISTEATYMLHKTSAGAEGIEFKAVRVSGSPGSANRFGEVGGSSGGLPHVMVRPTTHSPLPGGVTSLGMRSGDDDNPTSSEGSQVWILGNPAISVVQLKLAGWEELKSAVVANPRKQLHRQRSISV